MKPKPSHPPRRPLNADDLLLASAVGARPKSWWAAQTAIQLARIAAALERRNEVLEALAPPLEREGR